MALVELLGEKVVGKDGEVEVSAIAADSDVVGIYFSAHWCPPCRGFTPQLADYYNKLREAGKKFEIVFVSSDRDDASCQSYYGEMPWKMVPWAERGRKDALAGKYAVRGIPTLVLVNAKNGETITTDGRKTVAADPNGDFCQPK